MRTPNKPIDPDRVVTVKQNVLGRLTDVQMTAALAAKHQRDQRQWEAEKRRRMDEALVAIVCYDRTPNERHRNAALRAIQRCSFLASSEEQLSWVLPLIEIAKPEISWPAFMEAWPSCDATWHARRRLLQALQAMGPGVPYFSHVQRVFFDQLPPQVTVFRGCSRPRVRGVAWTTDRSAAEGFARGHRFIRVPEPVLASAIIPKEHIFFVTDDRSEKEVVLNPRRLRRLLIEPYAATVSRAA